MGIPERNCPQLFLLTYPLEPLHNITRGGNCDCTYLLLLRIAAFHLAASSAIRVSDIVLLGPFHPLPLLCIILVVLLPLPFLPFPSLSLYSTIHAIMQGRHFPMYLLLLLFARVTLCAAEISMTPDQCHIVTSPTGQAVCSISEMVVMGGESCPTSTLSSSAPMSSLQGWQSTCADGSVPVSTSAQCCRAATDSTLSSAFSSSASTLLQSGSFFSQCSWVTQYETNFDMQASSALAVCPGTGAMAVTGGGACATGWSLSASYAVNNTGWAVECSASAHANALSMIAVVQGVALCCQSLSSANACEPTTIDLDTLASPTLPFERVQAASAEDTPALSAPTALAYCSTASDLLISSSVVCGDFSQVQQQSILSPYGMGSALFSSCVTSNSSGEASSMPPARVSYQCCALSSSLTAVASSSTVNPLDYCGAPFSTARTLGTVKGTQVNSSNALGAQYILSCAEQRDQEPSAFSTLHLAGSSTIECLPNATWSHGGQLGQCLALDTQDCVSVHSSMESRSSSNSYILNHLSCPASADLSWVLVAAGGLCRSSMQTHTISLTVDEPTSLSTWQSSCTDALTSQAQPAELVTGVCCPAKPSTVFSSCRLSSGCGVGEAALLTGQRGGQPSASICCVALSASPASPTRSLTSVTDSHISMLKEHCPANHLLIRSGPSPASIGAVSTMKWTNTTEYGQQWSSTSFSQLLDTLSSSWTSVCHPSQRLCSWTSPTSANADWDRTARYWQEGTTATFFCQPGYTLPSGNISSIDMYCSPHSKSTRYASPQCLPTVCSSLRSSLAVGVEADHIFDTTGELAQVRCPVGLHFTGSSSSQLLLRCTGALSASGRDWQPPPGRLQCVASNASISTNGRSGRKLLQTAITTINSISVNYTDPYSAQISWTGYNITSLYNGPLGASFTANQLTWVLDRHILWPANGLGSGGSPVSSAVTPGYSGISSTQSSGALDNITQANTNLDAFSYIEGVSWSAELSIQQVYISGVAKSADDLRTAEAFLLQLPDGQCFVLQQKNGGLPTVYAQQCDPANRYQWWTSPAGSSSAQVISWGSYGTALSAATQWCLLFGDDSGTISYLLDATWRSSPDVWTLVSYPYPSGLHGVSLRFTTNQWSTIVDSNALNGKPTSANQCVRVSRCVLGICSETLQCTEGPPLWSCSSSAATPSSTPGPVFTPLLVSGDPTTSVLVATLSSVAPCGCDIVNNPSGSPQNMSLYQRSGQDTTLRLSFIPQSMCNDEFRLYENTSGSAVLVDIPIIDTYTFDTYASCSATASQSVEVEQLTWDQTSINRTFCLAPLPRIVCPTCPDEYIPGVTSPIISPCVMGAAMYWFTVSGSITTAGGNEGVSAPVAGVLVSLQVVVPNATVIGPQWSTTPLYTQQAMTDNNGWFSATIANVFSSPPLQFYEVLALPSKSYTYNEPLATILIPSTQPSSSDQFSLRQIGVNEHITIDYGLVQLTTNATTTQVAYSAQWLCPDPSGNVSTYIAFECGQSSAEAIQITAAVITTTVSTTVVMYGSTSQVVSSDSVTYTGYEQYEWSAPWDTTMLDNSNLTSGDPLVGQSVFGLTEPNPFNHSYPISTTPYLTSIGSYISPLKLIQFSPSIINFYQEVDYKFDSPDLGSAGFIYEPPQTADQPWSFIGCAGISAAGGPFAVRYGVFVPLDSPSQFAFLQTSATADSGCAEADTASSSGYMASSSMSTWLGGLSVGATYNVGFNYGERAGVATFSTLTVSVDSAVLWNPASWVSVPVGWQSASFTFEATSSDPVLSFTAISWSPTDCSIVISNVNVTRYIGTSETTVLVDQLVVPPSLETLRDLCAPICDVDVISPVTYTAGSSIRECSL